MTALDQLAHQLTSLGLVLMGSGAERIGSRFGAIDQHWHIFEWSGGLIRIRDDADNGLSCEITHSPAATADSLWYSIFHDTVPGFSRFIGDEAKQWIASVPKDRDAYVAFLSSHVETLLKQ